MSSQFRLRLLQFLAAVVVAAAAGASYAQEAVNALGKCLADNTTGKDRKELARWLFAAMTAHPEMKSLSSASEKDIDDASRVAGALFTRLMADNCSKEMRAAMASGGTMAIQAGFQFLGQLAMQELMTNPQVGSAMGVLDRHIDKGRLESALQRR